MYNIREINKNILVICGIKKLDDSGKQYGEAIHKKE